MRKLIVMFSLAAVLCCCAEEKIPAVSGNADVEAIAAKLKESEGRLDKIEKEAEQLRKEVDRLNELTFSLTKTLRALEIATQGGSTLRPEMETWNSIKRGITAEEVQNLLGSPEEITQLRAGGEVWYYYGMGSITFDRNGRVTSHENRKQFPMENKVR